MALSAANEAQVRQIIAEELTAALASGGSIDTAIKAEMLAHEVEYHGETPPPPPPPPPHVFHDATEATLTNGQGMAIYTDALNFEGAGYVGTWTKPGETVSWVVNVPTDGRYQILVSYQNAGGGDAHRLVNGKLAAFPRTNIFGDWHAGSWSRDYMFEFEFHAGDNVISFACPPDSSDDNYLDLNGWDDLLRVGDLPVDPPPPPPPPPPTETFMDATVGLQLNENGSHIQTNAPGFKGAGFLGTWGQPGEAIVFPVTVDQDGLYSIDLRYQCAAPDATREVNGVRMTLPRTAPDDAWDQGSWTDATATDVRLGAGRNDVTISIPSDSPAWTNWCDLNGIWHITRTGDLPVDPPPPPPPPPSGDVIDITTLGVVPNAGDQQAAVQSAIKQTSVGKTLLFPAGDYPHSGVIELNKGVKLFSSDGARLIGTDPMNMAVKITGDDAAVEGLVIEGVGTARQSFDHERAGVSIIDAERVTVKNCTVRQSSASGIFLEGAGHFTISGNRVENTLADSIHCTGTTNNGLVEGNTAINSGDDCFAVVSYGGQDCHHIIVRNNVGTNGQARGCSVVGGRDVTIEGNKITASRAAGIYLASEPSYSTEGVDRVVVKNNTLTGCNTDPAINHGGIFLWGGRPEKPVNDVTLDGNIIKDTPVGGAHMVVQGTNVHRTTFIGNNTSGAKPHHYIEAASADWTMQSDVHNGQPVPDHGVVTPPPPPVGDVIWDTMVKVHKPGPGTQYVAPNGNDANNGSSGSRKRTVQAAINALGAGGGIVYVADGSYNFGGLSRSNGSNTAWVLVKAENRWGVKSSGFSLSGSYLGVYGIEVAGSDISYSNGAFLAVWRCYVHDHPAGQGIGAAGNNSHVSNVSCCFNLVHTTSRDNVWATSNISFYHFTNAIGSQNHDWVNGYDNLVIGNITHHGSQGPGTPQSDGNGIIIDDMQCLQNYGSDHSGINYRGNWLIMGNLAVANGPTAGAGVHCFQTDFVDMCFNTAAANNSVAMDMNAGAGQGVRGDIYANLTWQTNWWDGYLWSGASDANVFLAGSANPSGRGQLSGSRNRSGEGGAYFKTNSPTLYPDLTTAEQWRPDGGSGAVERYTISQAQYDKWSVFPDLLGTIRPANRAWACGALEA